MASKFGKNGPAVEQFYREVSGTRDLGRWAKVLAGYNPKADIAAMDAIRDVGLSASVDSAIGKATYTAVGPTGLADEDFPERERGAQKILGMVDLAAVALALASVLPAEHRRNLLGPFAAAGFVSVLVGMPDEDEPSGASEAGGA